MVIKNAYIFNYMERRMVSSFSKNRSAWCSLKTRAGRRRIALSPHPPVCTPCSRSFPIIQSRLAPVSQLTAQKVPLPLTLLRYPGYLSWSEFNPTISLSPALMVSESRFSALIVFNTASNRIN